MFAVAQEDVFIVRAGAGHAADERVARAIEAEIMQDAVANGDALDAHVRDGARGGVNRDAATRARVLAAAFARRHVRGREVELLRLVPVNDAGADDAHAGLRDEKSGGLRAETRLRRDGVGPAQRQLEGDRVSRDFGDAPAVAALAPDLVFSAALNLQILRAKRDPLPGVKAGGVCDRHTRLSGGGIGGERLDVRVSDAHGADEFDDLMGFRRKRVADAEDARGNDDILPAVERRLNCASVIGDAVAFCSEIRDRNRRRRSERCAESEGEVEERGWASHGLLVWNGAAFFQMSEMPWQQEQQCINDGSWRVIPVWVTSPSPTASRTSPARRSRPFPSLKRRCARCSCRARAGGRD